MQQSNNIAPVNYGVGYYVSTAGEVFSTKNGELKRLTPLLAGYGGYEKVRLYSNGKYKNFFVHRLVASAFIPNPDNFPVVNHKDENPRNNHVNNLEWCTVEYNNSFGTVNNRKSEKMKKRFETDSSERKRMAWQSKERVWREETKKKIAETLSIPVVCKKNGTFVQLFPSAKVAEEKTGIKRSNICKVLKGQRKYAGGYLWEYAACGGEIDS